MSVPIQQCIAIVPEPPHYIHEHRCPNRAKTTVETYALCGVHTRIAEKWKKEQRLDEMVEYWWVKKQGG